MNDHVIHQVFQLVLPRVRAGCVTAFQVLLVLIRAGYEAAHTAIVEECLTRLHNQIASRFGHSAAQDATQEAFTALWAQRASLGSFENMSALRAWLYSVAFHHAMSARTKTDRLKPFPELFEPHAPTLQPADELEQVITAEEQEQNLTWAREQIDALPPERRMVFYLRYTVPLTRAEIAQRTGISEVVLTKRECAESYERQLRFSEIARFLGANANTIRGYHHDDTRELEAAAAARAAAANVGSNP